MILEVKNLYIDFLIEHKYYQVVRDLNFNLQHGHVLGIVGESGCGKTVSALSIMRLLPSTIAKIQRGQILFENIDLLQIPVSQIHTIRGRSISMIFQEPLSALNPVYSIGHQLKEIYNLHFPHLNQKQRYESIYNLCNECGISDIDMRLKSYPHQLSGGIRQRIMLVMAFACNPKILIADEPTTALDVTLQAQILNLMIKLKQKRNMSIIFITHDLSIIANIADDVLVMYGGLQMEYASSPIIFSSPLHPYTKGLLQSIPHLKLSHKSTLHTIKGYVPAISKLNKGCPFYSRCEFALENKCKDNIPPLEYVTPNHQIRCFRWQDIN